MRPGKNREISDILQSHNMLPARWLQKKAKTSIYRNAEFVYDQTRISWRICVDPLTRGRWFEFCFKLYLIWNDARRRVAYAQTDRAVHPDSFIGEAVAG